MEFWFWHQITVAHVKKYNSAIICDINCSCPTTLDVIIGRKVPKTVEVRGCHRVAPFSGGSVTSSNKFMHISKAYMLSYQNIWNLFSYVILRFLKRFRRNAANYLKLFIFEPEHNYKMTRAPSENSDQPMHHSLAFWSVIAVRMEKLGFLAIHTDCPERLIKLRRCAG